MRKQQDTSQQFIGSKVTITKASNKTLVGIRGTIVDETQNTFIIHTTTNNKRVMKKGLVFECIIDNKTITINGDHIIGSPEERVKKQ